jgi:transposase
MSTRSTPYPDEFRSKILDLYDSGRSIRELAEEFEPCEATIRNWVKQHEIDTGEREDGLTSEEKEELKKLRAENRQLKEEREILKKATAWFAQETDPTNSGSSSS